MLSTVITQHIKPLLELECRLSYAALLKGRNQVQYVAFGSTRKTVERVLVPVGVERVLALAFVKRALAAQFLAPALEIDAIVIEHLLDGDRLLDDAKVYPLRFHSDLLFKSGNVVEVV